MRPLVGSLLAPISRGIRMASSSAPSKLQLKNPDLWRTEAVINGAWGKGSAKGTFAVTDPATGEEIGSVPEMGVEDVDTAVKHAHEAFKKWSKQTAQQRSDILLKLYALVNENADDLARIITLENGKPLADSKGEIAYGNSFVSWFAAEALRDYGDVIPAANPALRNVVIKQPIGVAGILTPWNFPNAMITRKVAPALAAGCTVVIKAPPETPFSALAWAHLAEKAGVPAGVINVITTSANTADVGLRMCEHPVVKKISFTGSTNVGKILAKQSALTLKKLSFELGGNAAFIVFDDADIDAAVDGAIACKFRSSGQTCVCANRLFVHSSIYAEFCSRLVEKVNAFKVGNGFDEGITHGPLIHSKAVEKVQRHVQDAKSKGASVLTGGEPMEGNFFQPTVLCDVTARAEMTSEETFGPVAGVIKFDTEAEVIAAANDTDVGLASYFYSRDIGRIWRVAEALEVGMVGVNTGLISQAVIPFGGVKESGFGREGSKYGMQDYQVVKVMCMAGLDS